MIKLRNTEHFEVTSSWLDKNKTAAGGYTRKQVEAIGLKWPLVSGWKREIVGKVITCQQAAEFEQLARGKPAKVSLAQAVKVVTKGASKLSEKQRNALIDALYR